MSKGGTGEDPVEVLGYLLKHAHLQLEAVTTTALAPFGVDPRELGVLRVLAGRESTSQQDVATVLGVDRTTMVALVDELEAKGIVARHSHPHDRRRNVVELTEPGQQLYDEASKAYTLAESSFLDVLGTRDVQQLRKSLRDIVHRNS